MGFSTFGFGGIVAGLIGAIRTPAFAVGVAPEEEALLLRGGIQYDA